MGDTQTRPWVTPTLLGDFEAEKEEQRRRDAVLQDRMFGKRLFTSTVPLLIDPLADGWTKSEHGRWYLDVRIYEGIGSPTWYSLERVLQSIDKVMQEANVPFTVGPVHANDLDINITNYVTSRHVFIRFWCK